MKLIIIAVVVLLSTTSYAQWHTNLKESLSIAEKNEQLVLLNFSGSDWCGPCIRLRKEILDNPAFEQMAEASLVLVNADFPRNKKNQLDKMQQEQNDELAAKYNPTGKFPFTLLLSADGQILKTWEGFPKTGSQPFINDIKSICDEHRKKQNRP